MRSIGTYAGAALLFLSVLAGAPFVAQAQTTLPGSDFVDYVGMADNGVLLSEPVDPTDSETRLSFSYRESASDAFSADFFQPGAPDSGGFTVVGAIAGAVSTLPFQGTNSENSPVSDGFSQDSGPTATGTDTLSWTGSRISPLDASASLSIAKTVTYPANARHITVDVTLENTGTRTFNDVYYMYFADPDQGATSATGPFVTVNDVQRQAVPGGTAPFEDNSFVSLGTVAAPLPVFLGVGAFDVRSRVHVGAITNADATGSWNFPSDPNGAVGDLKFGMAFNFGTLLPGESVSLRFYFVFGTSADQVLERFDDLRCDGAADGTVCAIGADAGLCYSGSCCTGCWDGSACQVGTEISACGTEGQSCSGCEDGIACTTDTCNAGSCGNALQAGACLISGLCVTENAPNPANDCELCLPGLTQVAWSNAAAGTLCDDGDLCTGDAGDSCDGAGTCIGLPKDCNDGLSCTSDSCDSGTGACENAITSGCVADGACRLGGSINPVNVCERCDPATTTTDWTPVSAGVSCDDGAFCTGASGDSCDGAGNCAGPARVCPDTDTLSCTVGACSESSDSCGFAIVVGTCLIGGSCLDDGDSHPSDSCRLCDAGRDQGDWSIATGSCLIDGACVAAGEASPSNPCLVCDPAQSQTAYSPKASGERCGDPSCTGGVLSPTPLCDATGNCLPQPDELCVDGVCVDAISCTGVCDDDLDCLSTQQCNTATGQCEEPGSNGEVCADGSDCASGFCADGVCCESACDGLCESCALPSAAGSCEPIPAGTDPEDECAGALVCDGARSCGDASQNPPPGAFEVRGGAFCGVSETPQWPVPLLFALLALALLRRREGRAEGL